MKVFSILNKCRPDLQLVLAGQGPFLAAYKKLAEQLSIKESVMFYPFLNRREIVTLLSQCEMAVFPSFYEPFGLAAQESMEQGVLTAVSQSGGFVTLPFMTKLQLLLIFRKNGKRPIGFTTY